MGFYTARYIVGIFVTGFPNEARYLLISVCNELQLTPVTDTTAIPTVTCRLPAASWNQPGFGSHMGLHLGTSQDIAATTARRNHKHILTSQILANQDHIYRQAS
jgi:hypothetical protein